MDNSQVKFTYKEIRSYTPIGNYKDRILAELVCIPISPIFTQLFLKTKVCPNTITLLMILFGVLGAIFFSFPYIFLKGLGCICFFLWYIMDCCDGEVARITKKFSKYGREMDYMAHLICHPLMNFALWLSYLQLDNSNWLIVSVIFMLNISAELVCRNYISFNTYCIDDMSESKIRCSNFKYIINQFCIFPNFILFFSVIFILGWLWHFNTLYILCIWVGLFFISTIKRTLSYLFLFYTK